MESRVDSSIKLKDSALLNVRPELFNEWDFEKNDGLGFDIYKFSYGSAKKAWWNCPKCKSPYRMSGNSRTSQQKSNCPYCAGVKVNHTNSLASLRPDIAKEWHPIKNKKTPHEVTSSSGQKVWWIGKCGHPWNAVISSRTKDHGAGCPYCSNQKAWRGFNDMWTTNPSLAELLADLDVGYKYTHSSGKKVDWKCLDCKNIIKNKRIADINSNGLSCSRCSDGVKFPEKFMYNLLKEAGIKFEYDTTQEWSGLSRYDFYLPKYNWIIETHGGQHYGNGFSGFEGGRTLKEEQENDLLKAHLAKENKIDEYIIIDSRHSTIEHMKNSILNSYLSTILRDDTDYIQIGRKSSQSFIKTTCDIWNSGMKNTREIADKTGLHPSTITVYLKRGVEIGWCDYSVGEVRKIQGIIAGKSRRRQIVQLDVDLNFICEWESATEAGKILKMQRRGIPLVCTGRNKTAGGFKWMYKEDYNKLIQEGMTHKEYMIEYYPKQ